MGSAGKKEGKKQKQEKLGPAWLDNAIFYEIYPQSFRDSNGDGIGDFHGIMEKLDYIKELGCNAIWMNPCFESPFGDAGYDVSNYYKAAPRYGTNEDLKRLFDEVHKREMHILLDLVPGHTSVNHEWFRQSLRPEQNEYTDRYIWTDSIWKEPAGYGSLRGISDRNGSCMVNFFSHQPALNYGFYKPDPEEPWQQAMDAPGPRSTLLEMMNVMRFWLGLGCDGFRVDMAGQLVKGDVDGKGNIALWQEVREFLDREFPEAAMVSEWGEPDKSLQGGFHMDFLLHFGPSHYNDLFRCEKPFFAGEGDVSKFVEKYLDSYQKAGGKGLICIPSGNHDMARLAKYVKGDRLKLAFAFLLTMPGAPFIYYGDEIGMPYVEKLFSVEGGYDRTGARSPMLWDRTPNAGFSSAPKEELYIPQPELADVSTAADQMEDRDSLRSEIQRLISIRQAHKALQSRGEIEFVHAREGVYPLAYLRFSGEERYLVVINPSDREEAFTGKFLLGDAVYTFGGRVKQQRGKVHVDPCTAGIYEIQPWVVV